MNADSAALFDSHSHPTIFLVCIVISSKVVVLGGFDLSFMLLDTSYR